MRRWMGLTLVSLIISWTIISTSICAEKGIAAPEWIRALYVPSKTSIGLAWQVVPGADKYRVLRSTTPQRGYQEIALTPLPTFIDKQVQPGTTYFYVLQAILASEGSPLSEERNVIVPGSKKIEVSPPEWSVIESEVREDGGKRVAVVHLMWQKPEASNVISFTLYRKGPGQEQYEKIASVMETKYVDRGVEIGKNYTYAITSVDSSFTETKMSEPRTVEVKDVGFEEEEKVKITLVPRQTRVIRRHQKGDRLFKEKAGTLELEEPYDVVADETGGLVYFSSTNTKRVVVFDLEGKFVRYIGQDGSVNENGVLIYPLGLGIDRKGNIYVADSKRRDVQIFDKEGKFIKKLVLSIDESTPYPPEPKDVAVTRDGVIYVVDCKNGQVQVFAPNGRFKFKFSNFGVGPGMLQYPNYIELTRDDERLVVVNSGASMISLFSTKDGNFIGQWGGRKNEVGKFEFIAGVAVDKDDQVYVSDLRTNFIQAFNLDGQYLFSLGSESGRESVPLFAPRGICIDSQDRLYATEGMIGRVSVLQMLLSPAHKPQGPPISVISD